MSSPSFVHEGVIKLVRNKPEFAADLMRDMFHIEVPPFDEARLDDAKLSELVPVEYSADAVVLFTVIYDKKKPVFGTIFEVQLECDERKRFTWPVYGVAARARWECPFVVTAVTRDRAVAQWASQPIDLGDGMTFRVRVIGPDGVPQVTDHDQARRDPELAVLSAVTHGGGDLDVAVPVARAALYAVMPLPPEQRLLYSLLIQKALSEAARKALAMETQIEKFLSETQLTAYNRAKAEGKAEGEAKGRAEGEAKGRAEGKAEGKAETLLMILKQRRLRMTDEQQQRIATCTHVATLDRWLTRALTVSSVDELLSPRARVTPRSASRSTPRAPRTSRQPAGPGRRGQR